MLCKYSFYDSILMKFCTQKIKTEVLQYWYEKIYYIQQYIFYMIYIIVIRLFQSCTYTMCIMYHVSSVGKAVSLLEEASNRIQGSHYFQIRERSDFSFRELTGRSGGQQREVVRLLGEVNYG